MSMSHIRLDRRSDSLCAQIITRAELLNGSLQEHKGYTDAGHLLRSATGRKRILDAVRDLEEDLLELKQCELLKAFL